MHFFKSIIILLLLSILLAAPVMAAKRASAHWGGQLFKDPTLSGSKNDKSCQSCHADLKKLTSGLSKMSRDTMTEVINKCITGPMEGQPLDAKSEEMRALRMHLTKIASDCSSM